MCLSYPQMNTTQSYLQFRQRSLSHAPSKHWPSPLWRVNKQQWLVRLVTSLLSETLLTILSTPSSVWRRQIHSIYGSALTKANRKVYTCKQPNGLKCPIQQSDGWYKWASLQNKTDSEAVRDKQSNDTMLTGLSFLMWITGSDKENNGMTKGWQDCGYQLLLKTPERRQK